MENILTPKAYDFLIRRFVRKLSEEDWDSIVLFRKMQQDEDFEELQREVIVDGIMEKIEQKYFNHTAA